MLQRPLFKPEVTWAPPALGSLPNWAGAKRIAVDVETCDPDLKKMGPGVRRGGYMVGVSFAIEGGPAYYLPFAHQAGEDNLDPGKCIEYLALQARDFTGELVGANLPYDLDYMAEVGINFRGPSAYLDVLNAEPLIDELTGGYSLNNVGMRHGFEGKDETLLRAAAEAYGVDPKGGLWKLPGRYVGAYAEEDVRLPLKVLRRQERALEDQELGAVWDMECRILPVLLKMRRRGVRIDFDQLERVEQWSRQRVAETLAEIKRLSGVTIGPDDLMKPNAVAPALVKIGIEVPLTPKTGRPSVTTALLESVNHDVARCILRARKANKVRTTFCASILEHECGGRIHCTFNQLRAVTDGSDDDERGARFGRLSCSNPNLQQQPARDPEIGPMWRAVYVADEGAEWAQLDYSQQEPRWLTHYAELLDRPILRRAAEVANRYREDPLTDIHTVMTQMIHGEDTWNAWDSKTRATNRSICKQIFLGLCYGMGGAKLCHELNLETQWVWSPRRGGMMEVAGPEGEALLHKFNDEVPFVRGLARRCQERAEAVGYVVTAGGRRCRFPRENGKLEWTNKALNRVVQGSSADQTKLAMIDADAAGIPMQLQVHDELDLSVEDRIQARELAEIMRKALPANVPFKVDPKYGPNWGQLS